MNTLDEASMQLRAVADYWDVLADTMDRMPVATPNPVLETME
jgi:hypothetical protein